MAEEEFTLCERGLCGLDIKKGLMGVDTAHGGFVEVTDDRAFEACRAFLESVREQNPEFSIDICPLASIQASTARVIAERNGEFDATP